ncbi:MAG TPA: DNA mismatch repair protein MutS [Devosiaceae bacterium]|nr:DNA mismatch repair protein MutS [Devosiaceae bacterium]
MNDALTAIDRPSSAPPGSTPMMAQYFEIKAVNPDCLLFYRMGDFYELFFKDAEIAARALGIALTRRGKHLGADIPMCGVPVHAAQDYLKRLIALGHRVAVCEQVEEPAEAKKRGAKSVVKRDVVRIITPGTLTEDDLLPGGASNFLMAPAMLRHGETDFAAAWADISTGEVHCADIAAADLADEFARIAPAEIILNELTGETLREKGLLPQTLGAQVMVQPRELFSTETAAARLAGTWSAQSLDPTTFSSAGRAALAALATYVRDTQKGATVPLRPPLAERRAVMVIDAATRHSLELVRTQRGEARGALLDGIDACVTPPGSRLLAARLSAPSCETGVVNARLDMLGCLADDTALIDRLRARLRSVPDIARAVTRLSLGRGGPRDLAAIAAAVSGARQLAVTLGAIAAAPEGIVRLAATLGAAPDDLAAAIQAALADDLPLLPRDGGFVRPGYDDGLDAERRLASEGREIIAALQSRYAGLAGVKALKVRHNNVLGYFVEVTAAHGPRLMEAPLNQTFIHRQTMANAMRFSTAELGDLESRIARAAAAGLAIELDIFERLRAAVLAEISALQSLADALAETDLSAALALIARERDWCRPSVDDSLAFEIAGGRHPVVEMALRSGGAGFVANDCDLGPPAEADAGALWLLTGPNMGGKSTFLRQNALIAILGQTGSYVPAASARLGVVDRVFSRVGASDDIAHGRSTFMVEMVETAAILGRATQRSLVVLDEIGRGTATFDGLSIAWACVEALHDGTRCRALFATHFHELTALAGRLDRMSNHTMKVREYRSEVIFLHAVAPGAADRSYGIQVARLAGLPDSVVERAREVLSHLESRSETAGSLTGDLPLFAARPQRATAGAGPDPVADLIDGAEPDELTPRQAIDLLYELKRLRNGRRQR